MSDDEHPSSAGAVTREPREDTLTARAHGSRLGAWEEPASSAQAAAECVPDAERPEGATTNADSTTPGPTVPLLAKELIQTTLAHLQLGMVQRRNAVKKWYTENALNAGSILDPRHSGAVGTLRRSDSGSAFDPALGGGAARGTMLRLNSEAFFAYQITAEERALVKAVVVELAVQVGRLVNPTI